MLSEISSRDYRAFAGRIRLPLRRLTVLLGRNNSGKTTLARLPLLVTSALQAESDSGLPALPLVVRGLNYGAIPRDLVSNNVAHADLELSLRFEVPQAGVSAASIVLQPVETLTGTSLVVSKLNLEGLIERSFDWDAQLGRRRDTGPSFDGLLPVLDDEQLDRGIGLFRRRLKSVLRSTDHIGSLREPLRPAYEIRREQWTLSPDGREAPHVIESDEAVREGVRQWYTENELLDRFDVDRYESSFSLVSASPGGSTNLIHHGQGVQQVLPVVAALERARAHPEEEHLLVVEEPELHLHPTAHLGIGDSVGAVINETRTQVLIETHSELLCLRLRRLVAEGVLDPDHVLFVWCDARSRDKAIEIEVRDDGSVPDWPRDVFGDAFNEVKSIVGQQAR